MQRLDIETAELQNGRLVIKAPVWQIARLLSAFKPGGYEFTPYKEKRSRDANAYCWKLCELISEALRDGSTNEDIYRRAIKAVGIARDIEVRPEDAKTVMTAWSKLGIGWPAEILDFTPDGERQIIRCWYGSSMYNTKQMSRLIDHLVQDAKAMGIQTLEDEQLTSLIKEWNAHGK